MAQPVLTPFEPPPRIPGELRKRRQWIGWRAVWDPARGKYDKIPICIPTGKGTDYLKPEMHVGYDEAVAAIGRLRLSGVGFVLTEGCGIVGGDLDDCRDPATGELEDWAGDIADFAETYFEVSPSGRGVRFFALGQLKRAIKHDPAKVELYGSGRFLTFTGQHVVGTPLEIGPAPRIVSALTRRVAEFKAKAGQSEPADAGETQDFQRFLYRNTKWGRVNQEAMRRREVWVVELFGDAATLQPNGAWRVKSSDLGEVWVEDLAIHPEGIKWWGVHDEGDPRQGKRTPIDVVLEFHPLIDTAAKAAQWLADVLGVPFDSVVGGPDEPDVKQDADLWEQFEAALEDLRKASPRPLFVTGGALDIGGNQLRFDATYQGPVPVRAGITDRLTRGFVSMISAAGNVGKSTYISLEALAIATENAALLGQSEVDWCGHCLLVTNEESTASVVARWRGQMTLVGVTPQELKHHLDIWSTDKGQLRLAKLDRDGAVVPTKQAIEFVKALALRARNGEPVAFLGLDPLVSLVESVGENTEHMDKVIGILNAIASAGFIAIDLAHHQAKTGDKESAMSFRGSTAIFAAVAEMSTLITLTAEEGKRYGFEAGQAKRTLRLMGQRQRDGAIPGVFYFERELMPLVAEDPREPGAMKLRTTATLKSIPPPTQIGEAGEGLLWRTLWEEQSVHKREIRRGSAKGGKWHKDQAWVIMQELHQWERLKAEAAILRLITLGGAIVQKGHDPSNRNSILFLDVMEPPEDEHPF